MIETHFNRGAEPKVVFLFFWLTKKEIKNRFLIIIWESKFIKIYKKSSNAKKSDV